MAIDCRFDRISLLHLLDNPFLIGSVGLLRGNPKPSSFFVTGLLKLNCSSTFETHNREGSGSVRHKTPLLVVAIVISIDDQLLQVEKLSAAVKREVGVGCKHDFVDLVWVWVKNLRILLTLLHLLTAPTLLLKSWLILLSWLAPSKLILLCLRLLPSFFCDNFLSGPDVLLPRLIWIGLTPTLLILLSLLLPAHKICLLDIIIAKRLILSLKSFREIYPKNKPSQFSQKTHF